MRKEVQVQLLLSTGGKRREQQQRDNKQVGKGPVRQLEEASDKESTGEKKESEELSRK